MKTGFFLSISVTSLFWGGSVVQAEIPRISNAGKADSVYYDFWDEGKQWTVYNQMPNNVNVVYTYFVEGSTVVDGIEWKQLYSERTGAASGSKSATLYRQEGKRIYAKTTGPDALLFDFGLEAGDTVLVSNLERLVVDRVFDTVFGPDNRSFRCWKVRLAEEEAGTAPWDLWVEGIGSIQFGPVRSGLTFYGVRQSDVLCLYQDGEIVYQNSEYGSCYLPPASNEASAPRAAECRVSVEGDGTAVFHFSEAVEGSLQVHDATGRLFARKDIQGSVFSLAGLVPGLYVYRFVSESAFGQQNAFSGKFVVQGREL